MKKVCEIFKCHKKSIIIVGIILALLVVGLVLYFTVFNNKTEEAPTKVEEKVEDKLVADLKATNLIEILANYYGKDEGICADMIKASVRHGADYLNVALADFISKA